MYVKIHKSYRSVVAVCDVDLIGKLFEEGKKQLHARESFYKGEDLNYEEVVKVLKIQSREDATFNIIGEKSVKAAIDAEIITEDEVAYVQGIPFLIVLL
ncbi:MAG: DUF424 family protein [Nanoarchaeota archaeon]|nr:DUF424 family protein [Nanoarchaeota archaeon]